MTLFDRDELGEDPEEDVESEEICSHCLQPLEDCECDDDEFEEE